MQCLVTWAGPAVRTAGSAPRLPLAHAHTNIHAPASQAQRPHQSPARIPTCPPSCPAPPAGTDWYLQQDGTISHEIKLTGILSTSLLTPKEQSGQAGGGSGAAAADAAGGGGGHGGSAYGTMVAPGLNAAAHQVSHARGRGRSWPDESACESTGARRCHSAQVSAPRRAPRRRASSVTHAHTQPPLPTHAPNSTSSAPAWTWRSTTRTAAGAW